LLSVLALPDFPPLCALRPEMVFAWESLPRVRSSSRQPGGPKVAWLLFLAVIPIPLICIWLTRSLLALAFVTLMRYAFWLKRVRFEFVIWFHLGRDSIATLKASLN